jgi:ERF superfamily protein
MKEPQPVVALMNRIDDDLPTVQGKSSQIFAAILRTDCDPAERKELYEFYRQIKADEAKDAFSQAMKTAQDGMDPVRRDAMNTHTSSKYARLETIDLQCRPIYARNGFSLSFGSKFNEDKGELTVTCKCRHIGGHTEDYELSGGLDGAGAKGSSNKTPIQAVGSTITYLKRYLTCMIFNIQLINEDNDGNGRRAVDPKITQAQADTLSTLLEDAGHRTPETRRKFYMWIANVEQLADIPSQSFDKAVAALEAQIRRRK